MRHSPALKPIIAPRFEGTTLKTPARHVSQGAAAAVLALIRGYKVLISPLFTGCCRFHPSCADYMAEAVSTHGPARGVWLGLRRLARCQPFGRHGFDPVPRR